MFQRKPIIPVFWIVQKKIINQSATDSLSQAYFLYTFLNVKIYFKMCMCAINKGVCVCRDVVCSCSWRGISQSWTSDAGLMWSTSSFRKWSIACRGKFLSSGWGWGWWWWIFRCTLNMDAQMKCRKRERERNTPKSHKLFQ